MEAEDAVCQRHDAGEEEDGAADAQQRAAGLQHTGELAGAGELAQAPERAHEQCVRQYLVEQHGKLRSVELQGLHHGVFEARAEALDVLREIRHDVDEQQDERAHQEIGDEAAAHIAGHGAHKGIRHRADEGQHAQQQQEDRAALLLNRVGFRHAGHLVLHLLQLLRHQLKGQQHTQHQQDEGGQALAQDTHGGG